MQTNSRDIEKRRVICDRHDRPFSPSKIVMRTFVAWNQLPTNPEAQYSSLDCGLRDMLSETSSALHFVEVQEPFVGMKSDREAPFGHLWLIRSCS